MNPVAYRIASHLKVLPRRFLIEHANGPRPVIRGPEEMTRRCLLGMELIRYDWAPAAHRTGFPKATVLTELGREVVCIVLGHDADSITASQFRKIIESPSIVSRIEQELAIARQWQAQTLN